MPLSPGHDLAEELHQVIIRVRVQALAQTEVVLVLSHLEDAGLALPARCPILQNVGVVAWSMKARASHVFLTLHKVPVLN